MPFLPLSLRLHLNAGLSYYDAVICAEKLNDDAVNSLWDIKRLANTSELLQYVKSIGALDRINNAARKLSDQPPQEKRKGLTRENSSDNSADEKIFVDDSEKFDSESHARMFGWFVVSLGIAREDALQSVNRLVGDGYDTIVDVKLLATQSEDKLMKYFNKLGHVDKVKAASKDTELELHILNEIVRDSSNVTWDDIAGLSFAKGTLREAVILPKLIPQIFNSLLRAPPLGVLLFGPPGTGKTMLAEAVAGSTDATFFSISASSINSKWFGESEKLVRTLFSIARQQKSAVIFIDEIDSLLSARGNGDDNTSRRVKTEFMVQLSGINKHSSGIGQLLVIAATNRPWDLDNAVLRRFAKRIYVPLPDLEARESLLQKTLRNDGDLALNEVEILAVANATAGYSCSDIFELCREASTVRLRDLKLWDINPSKIKNSDVRPIESRDLVAAMTVIRASVPAGSIRQYYDWNRRFGSSKVEESSFVIDAQDTKAERQVESQKNEERMIDVIWRWLGFQSKVPRNGLSSL